ncbi:MAG: PEP-CTERM sorting domain-containing protein [Chthoniobacterales bacterium]
MKLSPLRKTAFFCTLAALTSLLPLSTSQAVVLTDITWDPSGSMGHNSTRYRVDTVSNPSGSGNSGQVVKNNNAYGTWNNFYKSTGVVYTLADYNLTAGTSTLSFTTDIYIPTTSLVTNNDEIILSFNWNDNGGPDVTSQTSIVSAIVRDSWVSLAFENVVIPEFDASSTSVTTAGIYLAFRDRTNDSPTAGQTAFYLDNFKITGVIPEPGTATLALLGAAFFAVRRVRRN